MKKILQIAALVVAGILLALAVGLWIFIASFNADEYRDEITAQVKQYTGRPFSIQGEINLAPSLVPTLVIEQVTLGNPAWGQRRTMLSVDRLEAEIALLPLLDEQIVIHRIALSKPVIHLEIGPDGHGNWLLRKPAQARNEQTGDIPTLDFREMHITQAQISYLGRNRQKPLIFSINQLNAKSDTWGQPLKLDLEASYEGLPVTVTGSIGSLHQIAMDRSYPVSLTANLGDASGRIEGSVDKPAQLAGIQAQLNFEAGSLADFNDIAGVNWPAVGPLTLKTGISGGPGRFDLQSLEAKLDKSDLSGKARLTLDADRPVLTAELKSKLLNLAFLQPPDKRKDEKLFSRKKFNLSWLNLFDAEARIQAAELRSRDAELRKLDLQLTLKNGQLRLTPKARIADGDLNADIKVNALRETPRFEAKIDINNMLPEQLPVFQQDPPIRNGRTHIHFNGRGAGHSPSEIASHLDGKLLVRINRGQLSNRMADVAGSDLIFSTFQMINPLSENERASNLVCGVLNFDISDGVATADKGIALQTTKVNVLGSGIIDLETEAIDFRAKPRAREGLGISLSQLGEGVYVGGTIANPRPATDLKAALKTAGVVGAAVATGGLSVLAQGLFDRSFHTSDPCGAALGKQQSHPSPARGPSRSAEEKGALERAGEQLDEFFKDLFGG